MVRGDIGPQLQSQAAALNWDATAPATVLVGFPQPGRAEFASEDVHEIVTRNGRAALSDVHGTWLVAIVSGHLTPTDKFLGELLGVFADEPVVIGPFAASLVAAHYSAAEAIAGMNAVAGWSGAPRPVSARELLPERALLGDPSAIAALDSDVMRPLADAGPALTETLDAYLDSGVRSKPVRANCSFIQTPSATVSNASPTSPGAIPHCLATPIFCGWRRRSGGSVGRRRTPARQTLRWPR